MHIRRLVADAAGKHVVAANARVNVAHAVVVKKGIAELVENEEEKDNISLFNN